ncbi:MAG: holo-ACP synthase [Gammaproteobacteria bacterium]|nr:holo-ACP synthase [Gammaproteobacteria bacterium]
MIYGTGIDLVHVPRIAGVHERHGERFVDRLLHDAERREFEALSLPRRRVLYLAKAFAVKEAFVKAMGTGFRGIAHAHVGAVRSESGRPSLIYVAALSRQLESLGIIGAHVSISDEHEFALASVTLETA